MPLTVKEAQETNIREEICEKAEEDILKVLNNQKLTLKELVYTLANVLIDTGSSLEQVKSSLIAEEAFARYTENPTIGNALISAGFDMCAWLRL